MIQTADIYMNRCIELASMANGYVAPNPMVGAVLVYNDTIIGEGYHEKYGKPHAEVNCINSVSAENKHLISVSTLYVSLEPCAHYGKTPPCANLIIENKIPNVVIGCRDPFAAVNGRGIAMLQDAGVKVTMSVIENKCTLLNKRFFTFHKYKRPYIILKWAQTSNGMMATKSNQRLLISNDTTNVLVHKWRSEEAAIMVGSSTAIKDNPQLGNRLYSGHQPLRLVLDRGLKIDMNSKVLDGIQSTVVFNNIIQKKQGNTLFQLLSEHKPVIEQVLEFCCKNGIQSILVEGGSTLLQLFINGNYWDEARVITNKELFISEGLQSPVLNKKLLNHEEHYLSDVISYYTPE